MVLKSIQLGLIHAAVAMTLVPINSTLNRVMIKELALSATLVALLASLPYLFSPIQVVIGSFSDRHPIWGWRRTPYIALGLILCVAGVITAPYAAYLMGDNFWLGLGLGVLTFGAWGMGYNFAAVSYLSLATEISGPKGRSRTISVMFFMMILTIILTSVGLSRLLEPYSDAVLIEAFLLVGLAALLMGVLGLIGLENRRFKNLPSAQTAPVVEERYSFSAVLRTVRGNSQVILFFWYLILMLVAILGQDILLEPFAAEAFGLPVEATTQITSIWGGCFLITLILTGILERKVLKRNLARGGGLGGITAFLLISASGLLANLPLFYLGVIVLGLATGLSTVSNLSLMLDMTVVGSEGLFMGAWGIANAYSRLVGALMSGALRDLSTRLFDNLLIGYIIVFLLEAFMLLASLVLLSKIDVSAFQRKASAMAVVERASLAGDV
jgi:MFS transporter, BCD family, chlorophyll transporter